MIYPKEKDNCIFNKNVFDIQDLQEIKAVADPMGGGLWGLKCRSDCKKAPHPLLYVG